MDSMQRARLAKLCALLSSDKDGEVVAAARKASKLVHASGLTWLEVFGYEEPHQARSAVEPDMVLIDRIKFCLRHEEHLFDNEEDFLQRILKWAASGSNISPKQEAWLDKITKRIEIIEADV